MFRDLLLKRVAGFCELSAFQLDRLQQHYQLMLRWNKIINLTRIESVEEAVDRHYAESLFVGANLPSGPISVADIGSGAGFPGIPIAVLRPEAKVTLIESHQRKAVFLKEATRDLSNVSVLSKRAELLSGPYDWVVSRAVRWTDLERVAFRLAPKLALLCNLGQGVHGTVLPLPWSLDRGIVIVSRET